MATIIILHWRSFLLVSYRGKDAIYINTAVRLMRHWRICYFSYPVKSHGEEVKLTKHHKNGKYELFSLLQIEAIPLDFSNDGSMGHLLHLVSTNGCLQTFSRSCIFTHLAISQAATNNAAGLIACRFWLGAFETGVGPSTPLYLSFWYQREELASRVWYMVWEYRAKMDGLLMAYYLIGGPLFWLIYIGRCLFRCHCLWSAR